VVVDAHVGRGKRGRGVTMAARWAGGEKGEVVGAVAGVERPRAPRRPTLVPSISRGGLYAGAIQHHATHQTSTRASSHTSSDSPSSWRNLRRSCSRSICTSATAPWPTRLPSVTRFNFMCRTTSTLSRAQMPGARPRSGSPQRLTNCSLTRACRRGCLHCNVQRAQHCDHPNLLLMQQGIPCTQEPTEEQRLQLLTDVLRFPEAELPMITGITMGIYGPLIELEEPALRPGLL
jgi:hypothetical protein